MRELKARYLLGDDVIRATAGTVEGVPLKVANASDTTCPFTIEANLTRLPTTHKTYKPSYFGALVHVDVVGPHDGGW